MFEKLTVKARVLIGFGLALVVAVVVGAIGYLSAGRVSASLDAISRVRLPAVVALSEITDSTMAAVDALDVLLMRQLGTGAEHTAALRTFDDAVALLDGARRSYQGLPHTEEALAQWKDIVAASDAWRAAATKVVQAIRERDALLAEGRSATADPDVQFADGRAFKAWVAQRAALVKARQAIAAHVRLTVEQTSQERAAAAAATARGATFNVAAIALGAAALLGLGLFLASSIGRAIQLLGVETSRIQEAVTAGALDTRAGAAAVHFEFRPVLDGINGIMDAYARPMAVTVEYMTALARGEQPPLITDAYQGDFARIKASLNELLAVMERRARDIERLIQASLEGRLGFRGDPTLYQGDHARVIAGMNRMLDALVSPLQVAAAYVDRIAKGDLPERITAEYRGDFDLLKRNLNTCIDAVGALVGDTDGLARAAVAGQLSARADASRHRGDFRRIVEGVNATLDAVTGPLEVAARCVEQIACGEIPPRLSEEYAGDFGRLRDNLNTCITAVNALVTDSDDLVQAALAGRLSHRADATRHRGDFGRVVDGFNRTMDAVIAPVSEATSTLERLAARDLCARVSGEFLGDHARLKEALNGTAQALHDAMAQVSSAVEQVSSAASQIASSSHAVASGASQQASSLAETTSAIDTVAGMTTTSADRAREAHALSLAARAAADGGASAVGALTDAMGKIRQSAERTSQIIRDVSDIAFQTNLLALNAAVEAARAGEAGRGFAVVAEEVRSLARRAKEAATKTEELIRDSVSQAGQGEAASQQVAGRLGEIVQGVSKATDIVWEISSAARAQAESIAQVTAAISEMDKVTQQNAASAEESSSAASELSGQAEELAAMVGSFRLSEGQTQPQAHRPRPGRLGNGLGAR